MTCYTGVGFTRIGKPMSPLTEDDFRELPPLKRRQFPSAKTVSVLWRRLKRVNDSVKEDWFYAIPWDGCRVQ
jgi:hypothetical protein